MRTAIVSDVHSNLEALDAVLAHAGTTARIDAIVCLGDVVGYNAQPCEVVARLREAQAVCVAGNHDLAAAGVIGVEEFNAVAAQAALWSGEQLDAGARAYLAALPLTRVLGGLTLAHGSLRDPVWEYLLDAEAAEAQFALQTTPCSLVGHSHIPFLAVEAAGGATFRVMRDGQQITLDDARLIINPGSVGQPRDGDPRASYAVYDEAARTVTWHRVAYDIASVQKKVVDAGLDPWLAARLADGR